MNYILKFKNIFFVMTTFILTLLSGCNSDDVGDTYYTFKGETIGDYIANRPDSYSEFHQLLEISGVIGLLNAYGKYTCFIPDNEAMVNFYHAKGKNSLVDFSPDTLKKIAFDHIIKGYLITSDDFATGFIANTTMSGRFLNISINAGEDRLIFWVNTTSRIDELDIEVHNGIIHTIDKTLSPTENTLLEVIAEDEKFSLFFQALMETGLYERLTPIKDENYSPGSLYDEYVGQYSYVGSVYRVPKERKFGFTALMESNETFAGNNIHNLEEMKAYARQVYDPMYPQDAGITDIQNSKNSLNRFIAYHLINKKLPAQFFIEKFDNTGRNYNSNGDTHSIKSVDMFEYIETMCPNTLMEVRTLRTTNEYNIFNMIEGTGKAIRLTDDFDNDAINGVYHEIDNILAYSEDVDRMLSTKRLRMDPASFFPEFANNHMRVGHASPEYYSELWVFPENYIERVKTSPTTQFGYFNSDDRFFDYQGDEVYLRGLYEFEVTTLPIPAGTYEVRFGYQPTGNRGVAQLFLDNLPCGIPLDLSLQSNSPKIGYVMPGIDPSDPYGYENDKMMRNRGYMKGPDCYRVIDPVWYGGTQVTGRTSPRSIRRILGIFTFTEAGTHTFSAKAVKAGEFMFDYLEFVPLEVLEYEDIY